jgi:hypothetical protein
MFDNELKIISVINSFQLECYDYEDTFFVDELELELYKMVSNEINLLDQSIYLLNSLNLSSLTHKDKLKYLIVCYIISVKFYTDCAISKPYSYIIHLLKFNWLNVKNLIALEKSVLHKTNYTFEIKN